MSLVSGFGSGVVQSPVCAGSLCSVLAAPWNGTASRAAEVPK